MDRIIMWLGLYAAAFLFFRWGFGGTILPLLLSAVLMPCAARLLRAPARLWRQRRERRRNARRLVLSWPMRDPEEGKREAVRLVEKAYGAIPQGTQVRFLPCHGSRTLSAEDVLSVYRTAASPTLLLCACPAGHAAVQAASACKEPELRLMAQEELMALGRRYGCEPPPKEGKCCRFSRLADRIHPVRCLLTGLFSMVWYILFGSVPVLVSGGAMLFLSLWSLLRPRPRRALFQHGGAAATSSGGSSLP